MGISFIAIGASRNRALVVIGIAFLVVALVRGRQCTEHKCGVHMTRE